MMKFSSSIEIYFVFITANHSETILDHNSIRKPKIMKEKRKPACYVVSK